MNHKTFLMMLLILASWLSTAISQEDTSDVQRDEKALEKLSKDLSSDNFQTRQSATDSLISVGETSIPLMVKLAFNKDAEVRARAMLVLQGLSKSKETGTARAAKFALRIVTENSDPKEAMQAFDSLRASMLPKVDGKVKVLDFKNRIKREGDLVILNLYGSDVNDQQLRQLLFADLPKVDGIEAHGTKIGDAGLQHIKHLPLKKLGLHSTKITDAGLAHCEKLPIKDLSLGFTTVTDAGLESLTKMPLESLMLARTKVTDKGLTHLSKLPLKKLNLVWTDISDAGLQHLKNLKLEQLSISSPRITDAGIQAIKDMPLKSLLLAGTSITDDGLKHLTKMPIEFLWLYDTKVSDEALQHLQKLDSLQVLYIQRTAFSEKAADQLRKKVKLVHTGRKK